MRNTFTRLEELSRKAHYGRDMGVIRVGMMMQEGGKDEGFDDDQNSKNLELNPGEVIIKHKATEENKVQSILS